jgi:hypothetical protein
MADRLQLIQHKGKTIFLIHAGGSKQEQFDLMDDVQETIAKQERGSVLVLADFTGAQIDKAIATRIKEVLVFDRPFVKKSAWVGAEHLPKVFFEGFKTFSQRKFPTFATREEALEWLVKD